MYAEIGEVVSGKKKGREGDELILVDLTGTGAQVCVWVFVFLAGWMGTRWAACVCVCVYVCMLDGWCDEWGGDERSAPLTIYTETKPNQHQNRTRPLGRWRGTSLARSNDISLRRPESDSRLPTERRRIRSGLGRADRWDVEIGCGSVLIDWLIDWLCFFCCCVGCVCGCLS